jgi:hypothetical protein
LGPLLYPLRRDPTPRSFDPPTASRIHRRRRRAFAPDVETAWGPWDHKTYTVEDLAVGMIRFETCAMLTIETSFAAHVEKDVWRV